MMCLDSRSFRVLSELVTSCSRATEARRSGNSQDIISLTRCIIATLGERVGALAVILFGAT